MRTGQTITTDHGHRFNKETQENRFVVRGTPQTRPRHGGGLGLTYLERLLHAQAAGAGGQGGRAVDQRGLLVVSRLIVRRSCRVHPQGAGEQRDTRSEYEDNLRSYIFDMS